MGTPTPVSALRLSRGRVLTAGAEPGLQAWEMSGQWVRGVAGKAAAVTCIAAADFIAYAGLGPHVEVATRDLDALFTLTLKPWEYSLCSCCKNGFCDFLGKWFCGTCQYGRAMEMAFNDNCVLCCLFFGLFSVGYCYT